MMLFRPILRTMKTSLSTSYPEDAAAIRRMIRYRCEHAGVKEVEILLKQWIDLNLEVMNRDQLIQFHEEVLTQETPDLYKIMLGQEKGPELNYLIALKQFVLGKLNK